MTARFLGSLGLAALLAGASPESRAAAAHLRLHEIGDACTWLEEARGERAPHLEAVPVGP